MQQNPAMCAASFGHTFVMAYGHLISTNPKWFVCAGKIVNSSIRGSTKKTVFWAYDETRW